MSRTIPRILTSAETLETAISNASFFLKSNIALDQYDKQGNIWYIFCEKLKKPHLSVLCNVTCPFSKMEQNLHMPMWSLKNMHFEF